MARGWFAVCLAASLLVGIVAGGALAQAAGQAHKVGMVGSAFGLKTLAARVGDTLRFVNDDTEEHTVFVPTRGFGINLGTQKPGTEAAMVLGKPGRFRVECVNHAEMLLDVTVTR